MLLANSFTVFPKIQNTFFEMFLFVIFCSAKLSGLAVVLLIIFIRVSLKIEKEEIYLVFVKIKFLLVCLQGIKDTVRWPRPRMPPVVQMERKWALEYGNQFFVLAKNGLWITATIFCFVRKEKASGV
jgi:hypothetical protein